MDKEGFLRELEQLLQGIPEEERQDVLGYYRDYIEDAGAEREASVLAELGSPRHVAATVLSREGGMDGEYTERGYGNPNTKEPPKELIPISHDREQQRKWVKIGLVVFLVFFVLPRVLRFFKVVFGWSAGLISGLLGLAIGAAVVTAALLIVGVVLIPLGFIAVFHSAATGIVFYGTAMLCLGLGIMGLVLCGRVYGKWIPSLLHKLGSLLGHFTGRRKGGTEE